MLVQDGSHGLPKVLLEPAMTYPSMPCGRPPLKQPYGLFRGGRFFSGLPVAVSYPLGHPMPYASVKRALIPLTFAEASKRLQEDSIQTVKKKTMECFVEDEMGLKRG
jgi:hypothetical protein